MFVARRVLWRNKCFGNFICTNNALYCDEVKDENKTNDFIHNKNKKNETKLISSSPENRNDGLGKSIQKNFSVKQNKAKFQKKGNDSTNLLQRAVRKSVKSVAKELGGDFESTTEEILNYLKAFEVSKGVSTRTSLHDSLFRVEKHKAFMDPSVSIWSQTSPLNIFDPHIMEETESQLKLKIWDDLEVEELNYLSKIPAKNCFEEMIVWTEEGKLWEFPIDNDQGMKEEAKISFTEHIFMEQYLEPWCPKRGPIRKFMELVLIGLSKNHVYTLEEKKAHIDWFRKYFDEKKKLLQELGAMGSSKEPKEIGVSENS